MTNNKRNQRKRQLNMELSVLPTLMPLTDCQIYLINQTTSPELLQNLIQMARQTTEFTIDTEQDYSTHQPALIQIQFIRANSLVLLIEACHLPHSSSVLFWLIRALLKIILRSSNVFFSWGDPILELESFVPFGLFSLDNIYQLTTVDVQREFKTWYNHRFPHTCAYPPFHDDSPDCTCRHRPVKNPNNQWSLQRAIAYTFHEFLDKSCTKSNWSRPLTLRRHSNVYQYSVLANKKVKQMHEDLILYAVNDCLAVTKLMLLLDLN